MQVSLAPVLNRFRLWPKRRGYLTINPRFARRLRDLDLSRPSDFLDLEGEVVSGHADRHVVEICGSGLSAFLKREHRVPWTTRLRNFISGFGATSLAQRESIALNELRRSGVPVPQWMAHGEDGRGRAFLLLRRVRGACDLRAALRPGRLDQTARFKLARNLGRAVAAVHRAGFDAPDLSAKHVLIDGHGSPVLLDWPRARRRLILRRDLCCGAWTGLHASLSPGAANLRERMTALRAYWRALGFRGSIAAFARRVYALAERKKRHRSIRDQSDGVTIKSQRLRWIDGERLCVTRPLFAACEGQIPAWLRIASRDRVPWPRLIPVNLPRIGGGWLFHFPNAPVWKRWLGKAVGRPMRPASVRHSGLAFRLARYGVPTSQLLAFGGREDGGGFLLLRAPTQCRGLREWLALPRPARRTLIYRLGQTLHRAHAAGCRGLCCRNLVVEPTTGGRGRMRLVTDGSLRRCSNIDRADAVRDLRRLARELGLARPDVARMIRGYFAGQVIDAGRLRLAAAVLGFTHGRSP